MIRFALLAWILLEIAAFAFAGRTIGVLGTLGLVALSALLGGFLLRAQGAQALASLRGGVKRGEDPVRVLLRNGFRMVAALLLILPGLLGDVAGLLLLLPPVQVAVAADLARRGLGPANLGRAPRGWPGPADPVRRTRVEVVEAEWEEIDPPKPAPPQGLAQGSAQGRNPGASRSGWTRD